LLPTDAEAVDLAAPFDVIDIHPERAALMPVPGWSSKRRSSGDVVANVSPVLAKIPPA